MDSKAKQIADQIAAAQLVPVIALEDAQKAIPLCQALAKGGLKVAEITFRTAAAPEAIRLVAQEFPDFALGAGTVTKLSELEAAIAAGASFAVAPGCNPEIVNAATKAGLPFFPGVCTPSDIEAALACGCQLLKFFPAAAMGGPAMIKALYGPYKHRGISFMCTGGVNANNVGEYLSTPGVVGIGGSWFVANDLINNNEWDKIAALTAEAVTAAQQAKGSA